MKESYKEKLEKNVLMYSWFKVFTKRVDLPVITIYLTNQGNVSVAQLAIIAAVTSIVQLVLQIPTGYIADVFGNKKAIILGSVISVFSPIFLILMPNFTGGLLASIFFFGGYTFYSGAIESFIHDTLKELKKENEYTKVMGRAQSFGLIGNIILISLVPATYAIHPILPFVFGFISLSVNLWLAFNFTYPKGVETVTAKNPFEAAAKIVTIENVALFLYTGVFAGILNRVPQFRELYFQELGIDVSLFGVLLAIGSLLGAVMGYYIHVFDKLKPIYFYLFDFLFIGLLIIATGLTRNIFLIVVSFTLLVAYFRVRLIVVQSKLLADLKHVYKATLLSALNLFVSVGDMAAVTFLAFYIEGSGYQKGYFNFGVTTLVAGFVLWLFVRLTSSKNISGKQPVS